MYLKSIEIQGFKSFADKTVLKFGKGVTAVVGPNGSGKSNISDAVRWVLGEQSTKSLRGQSMEDVIFSGTTGRRPHGFAEVTLTIDNSDRSLNFENDDVSVTRRYYRSHESEYLINKAVVRLKDVHELFMDTGLGRDGYSMIGQGKIDTIVGSKSNERRDIFEEASGISRYRYRRIEAERKLEAADENMLRLKDIMVELESRVGPLGEQSKKALRFLELSDVKKELEIGLWLNHLNESNDLLRKHENKITIANAQYSDVENSLQDIIFTIEKNSEDFSSTLSKMDEARRNISSLEETVTRIEGEIAVHNANISHNSESIERLKNDIGDLENSDTKTKTEIERLNNTINNRTAQIEVYSQEAKVAEDELNSLILGSESISRQIEDMTKNFNVLSSKISDSRVKMVTAESSVTEIEARLQVIDQTINERSAEKDKYSTELSELADYLKKSEQIIIECTNCLKGYELVFETRKTSLEELKIKLDTLKLDIEEKKRRVSILEDLEKNMEGFNFAVKAVMSEAQKGSLKGVHGPISKIISVSKEYSTAVEIALGAALQNIVVDSDKDAKIAINFLKTQNKGRATFLPIATIKGRQFNEKNLENSYGFVGIASELCDFDDKYSQVVSSLLGKTVVAEDIDSAVAISKKCDYRFKIVTLDGQVVNAGGSLTGGSLAKSAGILSRSGDIANFKKQIETLTTKSMLLTEQYNSSLSDFSSLEADILAAKSELTTAQEDKIRIDGEVRRVGDLCEAADKSVQSLDGEKFLIGERVKELNNVINTCLADIVQIEQEKSKTQLEVESLTGGRDSVTDKRESISAKLTDYRIKIMEANKDIDSVKNSIVLLESSVTASGDKTEILNSQIEEIEKRNVSETELIVNLNQQIGNFKNDIEISNKTVNELSAMRENSDKVSQELRVSEREKTAEREKLNAEIVRLEERKENMVKEFDEIVKKLFDEYELTRTEAEFVAKPIENVPEAKRELSEVKNKIKQLGNVNVSAIEEFKEVNERYEYMSAQIADVENSRNSLNKLIDDLTGQMRDKFVEGFEKIGKNFTKCFTELFGGGHAELVMSEPNNILESGIDIVAKLPGKNVPSLDGLSGGEKALVAISIYFAIMMVNPPPFCFLDEVDTALDDINVDRFAEYMSKSDFETQFICVTHRRGTMEAADMLYGVTMQEKGVTKLLQLDVDQLIKTLNIGENN